VTGKIEGSRCWASALGDCRGHLTREHYISRTLSPGPTVLFRGLPWCIDSIKEIGVGSATANILCTWHNGRLSEADSTAGMFRDSLVETRQRAAIIPKSRRETVTTRLSGALFGQWLIKTHCNFVTLNSKIIGLDFVRGAFGLASQRRLRFNFLCPTSSVLPVNDNHVAYLQFYAENGDSFFWCDFYGFQWVVTDFEWDAAKTEWLRSNDPRVYASDRHFEPLHDVTFKVPGVPGGGELFHALYLDW
jgi:hypothetical protein